MMIRWKQAWHPRQEIPMTTEKAIAHALADSDPEARNRDLCEIVGRLLTVLNSKGVLLPDELITVLGRHNYEAVNGNGTKET